MSTYTIGEAAKHSGFSRSALRYYEGIGLVVPTGRTAAGYRLYDDRSVRRLAFIGRAKQLGCTLEEIIDLVAIWDGDRCGPVQQRFHELVTSKMGEARRQAVELAAFIAQLDEAAAQLSGEPVDGPCGEGCACVTAGAQPASVLVSVMLKAQQPPVACTLAAAEMPSRFAAWQAMIGRARSRDTSAAGGLRIEFGEDIDLGELTRLVAAEQRCCAFFAFTITVDAHGVALEVRAPEEAGALVDDLFGVAS